MAAAWLVAALACGALLTSCAGQDAAPLANQACTHVERALAAVRATSSATPARAARLQSEALDQVRGRAPARGASGRRRHDLAAARRHFERVEPRAPALPLACAGRPMCGHGHLEAPSPPPGPPRLRAQSDSSQSLIPPRMPATLSTMVTEGST